MSRQAAEQIIQTALDKNELDKLLLGIPEYCYVPHGSPAPGNTDLAVLLDVLYATAKEEEAAHGLRKALLSAIRAIANTYEGIEPIVAVVFHETYNRNNQCLTLNLPLESMCGELRGTIDRFRMRLIGDRTGSGHGYSDGRYGDLRRMNEIITDQGGPSIL